MMAPQGQNSKSGLLPLKSLFFRKNRHFNATSKTLKSH